MRIKPDKDLAPVTICADTPSILITRLDFPANTVSDLIAYVRANQGKVAFASPGSSTLNRLEMEVFKKDAGLDMVHVPYKGGAGPAVTDVLGGHVDLMSATLSSAIGFVKETRSRRLRLPPGADRRSAGHPDDVRAWMEESRDIVMARRVRATGTPRPIVDRLHAAIVKVLADPEI